MSSFAIVNDPLPGEQSIQVHPPSPQVLDFMAAGTAAALSSSLYNPLDCLKVRWQVLPASSTETCLVSFGRQIVRQEGLVNGLWRPGIGAQAMGMGLSSGIRFGCYKPLRDALVGDDDEKSCKHMILAGLVSGSIGYVVTTPFHLLKTKIQAQLGSPKPYPTDFVTGMQRIVHERGFLSLYRGAIPLSSRGALFTAGQLMGYDGLKTMAKDHGYDDNVYLHVASGISASFWASFLSAPADLVMSKYMSSKSKESLTDCVKNIYLQHGVVGFWRGWTLFFVRLTPSLLTFSTIYEQLRYNLGLGYFE